MREKFKYAGLEVKIKDGAGIAMTGEELSGKTFRIEDWFENVVGCSWMNANGNPTALEYAMRTGLSGNHNVPIFSNDVLYGKVGMLGHAFHVNELEIPEG